VRSGLREATELPPTSILEQVARIGEPATVTYPFSDRYGCHANGTVAEAEFYSAGSPAAARRYRYLLERPRACRLFQLMKVMNRLAACQVRVSTLPPMAIRFVTV
jgi:hypothetical protein